MSTISYKSLMNYPFSLIIKGMTMMACLVLLQACQTTGTGPAPWEGDAPNRPAGEIPSDLSVGDVARYDLDADERGRTVKVAILLPLSGEHEKLGQAMLNAANMALFDIGFDSFELLPKDTKGSAQGAEQAAREAVQDGAKLVLGPIFSSSVRAAYRITKPANISMIAFSTDWSLANKDTFLIGFLPFDQIERVMHHAVRAGYDKVGVISPQDSYGDVVISAYQGISQRTGVAHSRIERFAPNGSDLTARMRAFSDYDARKAAEEYAEKNGTELEFTPPFNAVLMPVGGALARQVGSFLSHYDLPPRDVRRLGTGLMDDSRLASDSTLDGAWFAAPEPSARQKFENHYKRIYQENSPRIASLAYDAAALSIILAHLGLQDNGRPAYDYRALTNPNGFAGVDGIFRFRPDGIVERGLAVLEYQNGEIVVIDPAPKTFQRGAF